MEREKELIKLINVLRRTSRMALQSEWTGGKEDAAAFSGRDAARAHRRVYGSATLHREVEDSSRQETVAGQSR